MQNLGLSTFHSQLGQEEVLKLWLPASKLNYCNVQDHNGLKAQDNMHAR